METDIPVKRIRKPRHQISPQQIHYAEERAKGLTPHAAATIVGYKSKASAYKAERNPIVREYLSSIQQKSQVLVAYKVETAMDEASKGMQFAKETKNAAAYVKAVELRAKLSGLLIDRVEVFTADLRGALLEASKRVVNAEPGSYALEQILEAGPEANKVTT